jgi:hypothetical protein
VCLHALSSFQRTDFTGVSRGRPDSPTRPRSTSSADRVLGNLLRLLEPSAPVNLRNVAGPRWPAREDLQALGRSGSVVSWQKALRNERSTFYRHGPTLSS